MNVRDNTEQSRFEAAIGSDVAVANYRIEDGTMTLTHTEVPPELRGGGVGEGLARAALDSARERGLAVVPRCPFMAAFVRRHEEYQDLLVK